MGKNDESLFQRLGGAPTVRAVVDIFYDKVLADPLLKPYFKNTDMAVQRRHQAQFIGAALGGPAWKGQDMRSAHAGMGITDEAFDAVAGHLVSTLKGAGVSEDDINTIVGAVAPLRGEIVEKQGKGGGTTVKKSASVEASTGETVMDTLAGMRSILESVPINVLVADLDLNLVYMNPASESTLRTLEQYLPDSVDNLVGQSIDIFHKNPAFQRKLLSNPKNLPHKANIQVGPETLALLVSAVRDENGKYSGPMVTWEVVTDKLKLENDAAKIQSMVENMPINVLLADNDFKLTYMNKASRQQLKTLEKYLPDTVERLVGQSIDIFHKDPAFQRKLLSNPKNLPHKANIRVGPETLALTVEAVRDKDNNYLGPMVCWEVITDRLRLENEAAKIQTMVEEMPINILMADLDFNLVYMNKASTRTLKSIEHLLPERVDRLLGKSIDIFHKDPMRIRRLLSDPRNLPHQAEIRLSDEVLALTVAAVRDKAGDYIGPMVAWEVITQKVKTRETLADTSANLDSSSQSLAGVASTLAAAAEETSSQAQAVAAASEQVTANMETVATGSEEMSATIKEIAQNASEAASVAGKAVEEAAGASKTVGKLGESSNEIGKVIKAITSIAQQTNLLALNATIEAARAGEAGKGFAVVANEVKELAKQTAAATEEITQKIETIQSDTRAAVGCIERITGIIKRIDEISNSIASAVEEQATTTSDISRNVAQASEGSRGIARNISNVASAANDASASAQQVSAASANLTNIVTALKHLLVEMNQKK